VDRGRAGCVSGRFIETGDILEKSACRASGGTPAEMLEAVSHFATGGMAALEARSNESAALLLDQMSAADQIAR